MKEFENHGVLHKINSTFVDVSLVNTSTPIEEIAMHFSESPTGNREISQIYKMVMSNSTEPEFQRGDRFYCDFIALGDVRHESFQYDVRLMGEMVTIHRRLMASGLVKYWDEMFRNWRLLKNMHRALDKQKLDVLETSADQRLRKLLIQMDTLEMILYMWIVCVGLGLVGFLLCEVKLQGVFEGVVLRRTRGMVRQGTKTEVEVVLCT